MRTALALSGLAGHLHNKHSVTQTSKFVSKLKPWFSLPLLLAV
jgi:hypothetical protein